LPACTGGWTGRLLAGGMNRRQMEGLLFLFNGHPVSGIKAFLKKKAPASS